MKLLQLNKSEKLFVKGINKMLGEFQAENYFYRDSNSSATKKLIDYQAWSFIPNTFNVATTLYKVYKTLNKKKDRRNTYNQYSFVDIGCGIGNIVMAARAIGFNSYGIELDEKLPTITHSIYNKDALKVSEYNEYDVVYMYMPIQDKKVMQKLLNKIANDMKVGAILIFYTDGCNLGDKQNDHSLKLPKQLKRIDPLVFIKI